MEVIIGNIFFPENKEEILYPARLFYDKSQIQIEIPKYLTGIEKYEIILGTFNGFGKATFINCYYSGMESGAGCHISKLNATYLLKGVHIFSINELLFSRANINIPALFEWFNKSVFNSKFSENNIEFKFPETLILDISNEFKLSFFYNLHRENKRRDVYVKESACLGIISKEKKLSIFRFIEIWSDFRKFLLFATNYDTQIEWVTFVDDLNNDFTCELIFCERDTFINNGFHPNTLGYKNVESNFSNILQTWFLNKNLSNIINLIIEKSLNTGLSRENYFLNICFSIEIFHSKFINSKPYTPIDFKDIKKVIYSSFDDKTIRQFLHDKFAYMNEPSFKDRLNSYSSEFDKILPTNSNKDEFIRKVVKTRNYLVHGSKNNNNIFSGFEMYYAAIYLETIIKTEIYKIIGINQTEIDNMLNNSKTYIDNMFKFNIKFENAI